MQWPQRIFDCHSHWGTRKGHVFQTPVELANQKNVFKTEGRTYSEEEMASYIRERVWHESQDMEDRADGTVVLKMQVTPGFELQAWIKGFLPHVQVLHPASLRDQVAADLERARSRFPKPARG